MAYSSPATAVSGPLTSGLLNSYKAALDYFANTPYAHVYSSAGQSITTNTSTVLSFNAEVEDIGGLHSTTTNNSRITAVDAGLYHVTGQVQYPTGIGSGTVDCKVQVNGTVNTGPYDSRAIPGGVPAVNISSLIRLAAGDYIQLLTYQSSGASVTTTAGAFNTFLQARWVRL